MSDKTPAELAAEIAQESDELVAKLAAADAPIADAPAADAPVADAPVADAPVPVEGPAPEPLPEEPAPVADTPADAPDIPAPAEEPVLIDAPVPADPTVADVQAAAEAGEPHPVVPPTALELLDALKVFLQSYLDTAGNEAVDAKIDEIKALL